MNSQESQKIEMLLNRLDAGESVASLREEGVAADYLELIEFIQAQRIKTKPNPEGLKQALLQASLLEAESTPDEWGAFSRVFAAWKPWVGVGVSMFGIAILTSNWWAPAPTSLPAPSAEMAQLKTANRLATTPASFDEAQSMMAADFAIESAGLLASEPVVVNEDEALLQAWQADFASDMEDFYNTKAVLEPLYTDPLFSSVTPTQS